MLTTCFLSACSYYYIVDRDMSVRAYSASSSDMLHPAVSSLQHKNWGGWSPRENVVGEWLQADLREHFRLDPKIISRTGIWRTNNGERGWVTSYKLSYFGPTDEENYFYNVVDGSLYFEGVSETVDYKEHHIWPRLCMKMRIYPVEWVTAIVIQWRLIACIRKFSKP